MSPQELKEWRRSKGWSQDEAAAELRVSVHTVRAWEQGRNPIPPVVVKHIRSSVDLKIPLDLIGQIGELAAERRITFDAALALAIRSGLGVQDPKPGQLPEAGKRTKEGPAEE